MEFLGKRVRVSPSAYSEFGRSHRNEYGSIEQQFGTIQEGIRGYEVRLESGTHINLEPDEVEILR